MSNKYFYVHNGLTVGTLTIDAATGNLQTSGVFTTTNTTNATNTYSGALQVYGGVGIGGNLYATAVYSNNSLVLSNVTPAAGTGISITSLSTASGTTSFTINNTGVTSAVGSTYIGVSAATGAVTFTNLGVQTLTAGTGTLVSSATGTVTLWSTETLQTVSNKGFTTTNSLYAAGLYDQNNRVVTSVTPVTGTGIGITGITANGTATTFTVNNYGVTALATSGAGLGVSASTGSLILTNLGVTALAGSTYIGVNQSTGSVTISNLGVQTLTAGTGTVVSSATGTVTVWSSDTLQLVSSRGATTNVALSITNTTISASTNSGQALLVSGGIGAQAVYASNVFDNGVRVVTNVAPVAGTAISVTSVSTSNGTAVFTINNTGVTSLAGGAGIGVSAGTGGVTVTNYGVQTLTAGTDTVVSSTTGTVTVWDNSTLQSITTRGATSNVATISLTGGTGSSTSTNGTLVVTGGVGISQNLNVGGSLQVWGPATFSAPVTFSGTATYVYSTNTVYTDNMIELHTTSSGVAGTWSFDDGKDIGLRFHYYNRTLASDANAALVLASDSQNLEWYSTGAENSSGTFVGAAYGTFKTGNLILTSGTNATNTASGALQVQGGAAIWNDLRVGGTVYSNGTALTNFNTGTLVSQANSSYNIVGGAPGYIPIQSAAGVTSFIATGTVGYILTMAAGNTATWQALSSLTAGSATTATDVAGGLQGSIPIQVSPGITSFINLGAAGTLLQAGATTATFVTTASVYVGNATNAVTAVNVNGGTVNGTTAQFSSVSTFSGNVILSNVPVVYDQTGVSVGLTAVTLDTFASATYRSAKYVLTVSNSGNTAYQSSEVLVIHDGTTPYLQDVSVFTGAAPIMTFSTTISGGNVLLQGTGTATGNLVKVQRIYTTV